MKICVLGLGYMGIPTSLLLAKEHTVIGVDIKESVVQQLNKGIVPFDEPGLKELMKKNKDRFIAKTEVESADVFIISVPTPLEPAMKIADLQYVRAAAEMIYPYLSDGNLVILESTVPPGTTDRLVLPILKKGHTSSFFVAHCPERAIPGNTLHEMIYNDRIIGGINHRSSELTKELYSCFVKGNMFLTDTTTAEFVKLMENTFRDVNIALANEFAQIAEESKINAWEAIGLANKHPRVNILDPGPGVGGHCIAIDPWFLAEHSKSFRLISLARQINDSMPNYVLHAVRDLVQDVNNPVITVLGVAYKADVDDARETPALKFIKLAENEGFQVKVHDPLVESFPYPLLDFEDAVKDSDCLVLITNHAVFRDMNPQIIGEMMHQKNIVDTRNILSLDGWVSAGFSVKLLGKSG